MSQDLDLFVNSFNQYVVTPLNAFGVGGFVFDIEGETIANLSTEITDHYLEDNTPIQDHIAVRPKRFTLKSYVGELVFRQDDSTNTPIEQLTQKLTVIDALLPVLSPAVTQLKEFIDGDRNTLSIDALSSQTVNKVADYYALVKNLGQTNSRQQNAYFYFKSLMEQKILLSVQTPFEFLSNMAIESIQALQAEESKYISDFTIVLKQIRTVSELSIQSNTPSGSSNLPNVGTAFPSGVSTGVAPVSNSAANTYVSAGATTLVEAAGRALQQGAPLVKGGNMPGLPGAGDAISILQRSPGLQLPPGTLK